MEDYRVLNDEQKLIREDFKKREIVSEMRQGLKARKSLFSQYLKFLRCNETLFPNNYLDIIELKDKEKLWHVYYKFNEIIMNLDTKERDILNS